MIEQHLTPETSGKVPCAHPVRAAHADSLDGARFVSFRGRPLCAPRADDVHLSGLDDTVQRSWFLRIFVGVLLFDKNCVLRPTAPRSE